MKKVITSVCLISIIVLGNVTPINIQATEVEKENILPNQH
ncbi:hypothetical protein SAMN05192559_10411 [Halobacillus karajensis]|nr:hypothetical protein SAMN05192559_10411 [Halobacillus karajensis]